MRLDPEKLDAANRARRADGDFPVVWARQYGKGRMYNVGGVIRHDHGRSKVSKDAARRHQVGAGHDPSRRHSKTFSRSIDAERREVESFMRILRTILVVCILTQAADGQRGQQRPVNQWPNYQHNSNFFAAHSDHACERFHVNAGVDFQLWSGIAALRHARPGFSF